ncbi:kinase phosphorylation protein, putative [Babesia ovata]|uniref:Kinase phosphorylation protein, putative n=1 Tax=Babesia ovata TaxID=189622 RepID=A0A2H6K8G0_9APIC|nr:kinase phosphorylation protein, putative [Babesia ovata]GBE59285.1 kinase phosphorylation protein, putative [Babesia ovata]
MDIRLSPPREGVRGGREQFKWDEVKKYFTKEREHYLGHSVKIGMIEHKNKFYKHDWYMKDEGLGDTSDAAEEMKLIKLYEDELMQEMLGAIPKRLMLLKSRPTDVATLRKLLNVDHEAKPVTEHSSAEVLDAKTSDAPQASAHKSNRIHSSSVPRIGHRRSRDRSRHRNRSRERRSRRSPYRSPSRHRSRRNERMLRRSRSR